MLRGPAHPENFRQQIGRYGDRHYVDNLPGDGFTLNRPEIVNVAYPSVSVIKKAWPKFLDDWAAGQAATYAVEHQDAWLRLPPDDAIELITKAAVRQRDRAAKRGSDIHAIIESLALGHRPDYMLVDDSVQPYVPCVERMVRELRIRPLVSEAVIFNHVIGYGGTFDMIADTVHGVGLLDWKTRKKTSRYDEEGAQVAAYAGGEYMIVESPLGGAMRQELPPIDYLATVVLSPEGYQVHEVDEEGAWNLWVALKQFWDAKNNGHIWEGTRATPGPAIPPALKQNLVERVKALSPGARQAMASHWPVGLTTLKGEPSEWELMRIDQILSEFEAKDTAPFNVELPQEGEVLDHGTWKYIDAVYNTLDEPLRLAVDFFYDSARPNVRMGQFARTVRRFEILRMLIYVATFTAGDVTEMGNIVNASTLGYITKEEAESVANQYSGFLTQPAESIEQ